MKSELKYFQYLLIHKWYVMIECFRSGLIWLGLVHDLSKFSYKEFLPYAHFFYDKDGHLNKDTQSKNGYCKPLDTGNHIFDLAWKHHLDNNKHHWQWWVKEDANGKETILPMQEPYLTEMICDWVGAGKAQGHFSPKNDPYLNVINWYTENKKKLVLADETRKKIEERISNS